MRIDAGSGQARDRCAARRAGRRGGQRRRFVVGCGSRRRIGPARRARLGCRRRPDPRRRGAGQRRQWGWSHLGGERGRCDRRPDRSERRERHPDGHDTGIEPQRHRVRSRPSVDRRRSRQRAVRGRCRRGIGAQDRVRGPAAKCDRVRSGRPVGGGIRHRRRRGARPRDRPGPGAAARGDGPVSLAFAAGALWVANNLDATVSRIDPRKRALTATIPSAAVRPRWPPPERRCGWPTSTPEVSCGSTRARIAPAAPSQSADHRPRSRGRRPALGRRGLGHSKAPRRHAGARHDPTGCVSGSGLLQRSLQPPVHRLGLRHAGDLPAQRGQ